MTRIPPGPFNGLFDTITYEHYAFVPVVTLAGLLAFVWIATIWALWRGPRLPEPDRRRGFEVKPLDRTGGSGQILRATQADS
jgi:hypothetical protein